MLSPDLEATSTPAAPAPRSLVIAFIVLAALQIGALFTMTALSGRYPARFDEPWHLSTLEDFDRWGLSVEFIREYKGTPPPLFALVHIAVEPVFGRTTPLVRVFNAVLTLICVVELAWVLWLFRVRQSLVHAVALMGLPTMYVMGGMALTELPAMLFLIPGLGLAAWALTVDGRSLGRVVGLATAGGLLLGLACLGRQTYLALGGALAVAAFFRGGRTPWIAFAVTSFFTLLLIGPVLLIWGGLTPPFDRSIESRLAPVHVFLSLSYAGAFMLFLSPRFMAVPWKTVAVLVLLGAVLALTVWPSEYIPMAGVARRFLGPGLMPAYRWCVNAVLASVGMFFLWGCCRAVYQRRGDPLYVFCGVGTVLLCLTALKIGHLFSSRYVAMAFPLMVVLAVPYSPLTWNRLARLFLGSILGMVSLQSFYTSSSTKLPPPRGVPAGVPASGPVADAPAATVPTVPVDVP